MYTTLFVLLVAMVGCCLMFGAVELAIKIFDLLGIDLDGHIEKWLRD